MNETTEREVELEERIRKLEAALAERSNAAVEDVVAERVLARMSALARTDPADRVLVLDSVADSRGYIPPPPKGAVLHPPEAPIDPGRRAWFFAQLLSEFRLIFQMYFDPRYRISRVTQFALPG